jgi:hypothetical protein
MEVFNLPVWIIHGENYAFMKYLDNTLVKRKSLSQMEALTKYQFSNN